MKKIQFFALGTIVSLGAFFTSCGGGISTDATLKSEKDSVSYAYGVSLYEQGLSAHLQQLGLVTDTASLRVNYQSQIAAATDPAKKSELEKEFKTKLDSVVSANSKNTAEFLKGLQESISAPESKDAYLTGVNIGTQISKQMFPYFVGQVYGPDAKAEDKISKDLFLSGLAAAIGKKKLAVENPTEIIDNKVQAAQEAARLKQEEQMKAQYTEQIEAGKKFLEENKAKEGVVTLPDGLQYKVIKEGTGAKPTSTDVVKVHYHGTLIDGTVFDSSVKRGEPATFNVSAVIKGWTEALQLMPVGSKWIIYVPYDLAYGAQERGAITPFSTLIFEVELLNIEAPAAQQ
ncbi:MAG: FKBP-type peptidyl-prolyl cis-trans isomerase [Dysgonomonas sp.]